MPKIFPSMYLQNSWLIFCNSSPTKSPQKKRRPPPGRYWNGVGLNQTWKWDFGNKCEGWPPTPNYQEFTFKTYTGWSLLNDTKIYAYNFLLDEFIINCLLPCLHIYLDILKNYLCNSNYSHRCTFTVTYILAPFSQFYKFCVL